MPSFCCSVFAADRAVLVRAGFNWKLVVTIFLLLEASVVGMLKPRVYKKFNDTIVETQGSPSPINCFSPFVVILR